MMADARGSLRGIGEKLSARWREKFVPSSGWTEDSSGHYLLVDLPDFKKEEVKLEVNISAGHLTVSGQSWQENGKKHVYFEENFTIPPNSNIDKITGKFDGGILYVTVPKAAALKKEKKEPEIKHQNVEAGAFDKPHIVDKKNQILEGLRPKHEGEHSNKDEGRIKYGDQLNQLGNNAKKFLHEGEHSNEDESRIKYGDQLNKLGNNAKIFFSKENIRKWENEDGIIRNAMEMLSKNKGIIITAVVAFSLGMLVSTKFPMSKKMT